MICDNCLYYKVCKKRNHDVCKCVEFSNKFDWLHLPFPIGTVLYRVTTPYRREPKITEFIVTNFVMRGKKHELMVEVRVSGVPGRNIMHLQNFYRTKEEAEKALKEEMWKT